MPNEYLDFLIIKNLYHCTPAELDEQDDAAVEMHREFLRIEREQEQIATKRAEQKARLKTK